MRVGVDTGGTFTDIVVLEGGQLRTHKVLSTPAAPEQAIITGLKALGVATADLKLVHGTTVATNAVLEGRGARTAFITSHGFGDTLTIARQTRPRLYDLAPAPILAPVPPELCLETGGRVTPDGSTLEPLDDAALAELATTIARLQPEAVAISLLFSFIDDEAERRIEAALPPGLFVARSSAVLPEYREYERAVATWLNARLGPLMQHYLDALRVALPQAHITVMQSSAGTVDAAVAARRAVHLLLSGPAGGVLGAAWVGARAGVPSLLTFDMGGTSTDVALVDGAPRLTTEATLGGLPVPVPMVDMHTIGAGGGSIAWCDAGGALQVGPQSAGADPGPACYGNGGVEATVTDAHVVLGHLPEGGALAGSLQLDRAAAHAAVKTLGERLGLDPMLTAAGILRIADEHMAQALRVISVERGEDPAEYALFPFGGAGGLHVCALAERLGMSRALFPANAGVLSALGMLAAAPVRTVSRTRVAALAELDPAELEAQMEGLRVQAIEELGPEGVIAAEVVCTDTLDLRYRGQSHTLEIAWSTAPGEIADAFHHAHEHRYGHRLDLPVELVTLRVRAEAPAPTLVLPERPDGHEATPAGSQWVHGCEQEVPVYRMSALVHGQRLQGPALVAAEDSTLWLTSGWQASVDGWGNLLLQRS